MSGSIHQVVAPLAGTYYEAPTPEDPPYVKAGQHVRSGDVVCIIESMKVFTELRVERDGIVERILVENEDTVTRKQVLMEISVV